MGGIGDFLGTLWTPFGTLFHYVFYLPIYNVLILLFEGVHAMFPSPAVPSFAIAIFFLTIVVRLALYPLTRKQLQSSRAMQALAPKVQELQKQYKNNPQELMAAQQALYREHGVSMYGGCLPLLIQMPFLYGLYYSLYTALIKQTINGHPETVAHHLGRVNHDIYPFLPHLLSLPGTHFLWTDLGAPDPWKILPILAGVLTFFQLRMAQPVRKPTPPGQRSDPNTQTMASMQFIMPFVTFFMALNFPSGLAFYWSISTAFSAVQQYFLTGFGSLFVGIPGLEHLVPEPQALPTPTPSKSTSGGASPGTEGRSAGMGGLRSMLRQFADSAAAQARQAQADREARAAQNGSGQSRATPKDVTTDSQPPTPSAPPSNGAPSARRPRPSRTGPTLVRPPSSTASPPPSAHNGDTDHSTNGTSSSDAPPARTQFSSGNRMDAGAPGPRPGPAGGRGQGGGSTGRRRPGGKSKGGR
ncbi:MAG TPA: YidC/Oxa1 family membrane protein insertase [Ktedonobacterales bacterium]